MTVLKKADVRATVVALAGAATALVLFLSGTAFAHAAYESSDPPDEGTVSSPPSQVTATFTEPLAPDSYMDVTDPCGRDVGGDTSITADEMTVSMSGTAKGKYIVDWRARSSVDNHVTTGSFSFSSTGGDPCPGDEPEPEEKEPTRKESSTSVGNDSSSNAEASDGSADAGGNDKSSSKDGGNSGDRSRNEARDKNGARRGGSGDRVKGNIVAQGAPTEEEERNSSTLDGIPVGGLLVTLFLSALIGAAAGKIYFSLSGEGE